MSVLDPSTGVPKSFRLVLILLPLGDLHPTPNTSAIVPCLQFFMLPIGGTTDFPDPDSLEPVQHYVLHSSVIFEKSLLLYRERCPQ